MEKNFKQIKWVNSGKQIGYSIINNDELIQCAVQKQEDLLLLYYAEWNMKYDFDDFAKEEYCVFNLLSDVVKYIESKKLVFENFTPQKGCKIFNPNDFDLMNT